MVGSIYKITNRINGKCYIGKTYKEIYTRFSEHISDSKKERCKDRPLYRAFEKHGIENFDIVSLGEYQEGLLEEKEIEFISKFNSFGEGYNATLGGDGKRYFKHSDKTVIETYEKIGTVKGCAEELGCCIDTIREILKNNKIEITQHFTQKIYCPELDIHFNSIQETVNHLRENKLVGAISDENIRRSINRVVQGTRQKYCGRTFVKE